MSAPPAAPPGPSSPPVYPPSYPPAVGYPPYGAYAPPPRADFSNLFSGMFKVWSENFAPLFVVYILYGLATAALSLAGAIASLGVPYVSGGFLGTAAGTLPSTTDVLAYLAYQGLVAVIDWILLSAIIGGVTDFSVRRYRGENVRIMDSMSRGFQKLLSILGGNLLVTVITTGVLLLWAGVLILGALSLTAGGTPAGGLALVCGGLLALPFVFVLVLYLVLALALYVPAIMVEGAHAVDSLGRSWQLMRGRKWPLLWSGIVIALIAGVIDLSITFFGGLAGPIGAVIGTALATAITGAWFTILASVAYELIVREPQPSVWPPAATPMYPPVYPPPR